MPNSVISNFYHRLLPLYAPRAEELLKSAHPEDMRKLKFRYIFTVKGMIDISYLIEDAVGYSQNIEIQKDGYNPYQAEMAFENLSNRLDIELEPEPQRQQSPGFDLSMALFGLGFVFVILSARRD